MATAVQVESLWNGLTDNNGQPLAAGKVFTYAAGTTTPVSLFTASDKSTSATNPLILDANGKAQVWADGRYKFVIKTAADVTLYTLDNLLYGFDDTTVLYGGTSTGSANAQVVSVPATVTSYANGQTVSFVAGFTNTGATTLKFNSLAAITLVKGPTPSSLEAGDLIAGQLYTATYHGGTFRLQDYPSVADVQRSRFAFATGVSGTNTITATLTPALTSYEAGMVVTFIAAATNTGAVTLNLNGLGAKTVQERGTALTGAELVANRPVQVVYDGTNFQIISNNLGSGTAPSPALFFGDDTNTGMYSPGADRVGIATNGVQRVEISSSGAVGIGVGGDTDPEGFPAYGGPALTVKGTNTYSSLNVISRTNTSVGSVLHLAHSRGTTAGSMTVPNSADLSGMVRCVIANGTDFYECGSLRFIVDGTPSATSTSGAIDFMTTAAGTLGVPVRRMRIRGDGNVGINNFGDSTIKLNITGEDATSSNYSLVARSSTTGVLYVRNDGRVGIGTSAPSSPLDVTGTITSRSTGGLHASLQQYSANSDGAQIEFFKSRGTTIAANAAVTTGDTCGILNFFGNGGSNNARAAYILGAIDAGTVSGTSMPGRLDFATTPDNSNVASVRMRITAAGEVLTGGTTDNGAYNLQCNGTGVWGAGAYVNGSDARIKDDVTPIGSTLGIINQLNPVTYKYKEEWSKDQSVQPGFIAQEVASVLANTNYVDGVVQQGNQYLGLAYQSLVPLLVKAVQELSAKVQALEAATEV